MKKVKFILPVAAILFAVAGVFATGSLNTTVLDPEVSALTAGSCTIDGRCTNVGMTVCNINSTGLTFQLIITSGSPPVTSCSTSATGTFYQF